MWTSRRQATAFERSAPDPRLVTDALRGTRQQVFWLHDAGPAARYPALTTAAQADLAVVGGGYLGLWTALLAKRRDPARRVIVLEGATVGWAASGRNGGFCEASITHGEQNGRSRWPRDYAALERLGRENLAAMEADLAGWQLDCQWERTGMLEVATEEYQVPAPGPGVLDAAGVRAQVNSSLLLAGEWHRDDVALVHPARLVFGLAAAAATAGVEIFEHSPVRALDTPAAGPVTVATARGTVTAGQVALATNAFPSLLRRNRLLTVPVYDYVLMTEPLTTAQWQSVGWQNRQGVADLAHQFHYLRRTADGRILVGGYDAIYHADRQVRAAHEDRPASYRRLAAHFLALFPQLAGIAFTHQWAGAIDTCSRFAAFHGLARRGRVAYAAGFTGLGVGATRFAAEVILDHLAGVPTERTELAMVRSRPVPIPPEPLASAAIGLTRRALDSSDHRQGRRGLFLRGLDAAGLGFDS